ncbi:PAS domain S-box protein [Sphingobium sp. AN641]|uniref:PAS domain-containing sensor histidine kinase n=1 Tax=Sphingobium sp. AN641 TaxID=3133443 RepID=UPI0030C22131
MAEEANFLNELGARRFELLVNSVFDYAIYMLDPTGHIASWNAGARRFKGYEAHEIIGSHFSRFFTDEDRASDLPGRALQTARTEGKFESEGWRVRKDGSRFWAHVVVDPIRDEDGTLIGFAKITRDNSDKKAAQEEVERTRAALYQAQKLQALGELTGGIAHDFNNLMTVIRGSADMLDREGLPPQRRQRYLRAIIETADHASTLISHLLAFGRRQPVNPEILDLNLRIDAIGDVLDRTLGGAIIVALDLAPDLWRTEVDAAQLETALLNAAFNARDAMPEGGRITIRTENRPATATDPDMVCVTLADTGQGMAPEVAERVFEPFFTTKPVGKGTGLGLSQIHGFAAQAGGRAEIRSAPGEGTALSLLLPRTMKIAAADKAALALSHDGMGQRVLLVEDNDAVRDVGTAMLEDLGYTVVGANCAEEALTLLQTHSVDLLLTDVVMPGRSGISLARMVRKSHPTLPILLASGYSEEIISGSATEFELLRKPFDTRAIDVAIQSACGRAAEMRLG